MVTVLRRDEPGPPEARRGQTRPDAPPAPGRGESDTSCAPRVTKCRCAAVWFRQVERSPLRVGLTCAPVDSPHAFLPHVQKQTRPDARGRHVRRLTRLRRRRTSDMGRRGRHVPPVGPTPPTAQPPPPPSHVRPGPTRPPRPTCRLATSDSGAGPDAVARPTWADAAATSHVSAPTPPTASRARRRRTSDMGRRDRHVPLVVLFFSTSPPASPQRRAPQVRHNATSFEWTRRRRRDQGALPPPAPSCSLFPSLLSCTRARPSPPPRMPPPH